MLRYLVFLLPIATISGWYFGFKYRVTAKKETAKLNRISGEYFRGLNYLINEQPDKAVDVFIKVLEVNSDTVEMHLALGNLFRRRGEVERAIRIHQNLIARPQLEKWQRVQALSELAQDYLKSGMLDRAERLFLELVAMNEETVLSYKYLQEIYEQQKNWYQAIEVADKLQLITSSSLQIPIAHYHCELADNAIKANQYVNALEHLTEALTTDHKCVRASIMLGKLHADNEDYKAAVKAYKKVSDQDADFISEVIVPLGACYAKNSNTSDFVAYLESCREKYPRVSIILALADHVRHNKGDGAAIEFISDQINRCLSLKGLDRLVDIYLSNVDLNTRNKLLLLKKFIEQLTVNKPVYRCINCGFSGKQLYWQCPSCKRWSTVKPIHGIEGD